MSDRSRLTLSLPDADWQALAAEAQAAGLKIGTHAQRILRQHVADAATPSLGAAHAKRVNDKWAACFDWLTEQGINIEMLKAKGYKTRTQVMERAQQIGWEG